MGTKKKSCQQGLTSAEELRWTTVAKLLGYWSDGIKRYNITLKDKYVPTINNTFDETKSYYIKKLVQLKEGMHNQQF